LPVPVSPSSRTVEVLGATVSTRCKTCRRAGLVPTMPSRELSLSMSLLRSISWSGQADSENLLRAARGSHGLTSKQATLELISIPPFQICELCCYSKFAAALFRPQDAETSRDRTVFSYHSSRTDG